MTEAVSVFARAFGDGDAIAMISRRLIARQLRKG